MKKTIRYATKYDTPDIIKLWDLCFNDPLAWRDWYFSAKYSPERTLVLQIDDEIVSALQLRYYTYKLGEHEILAPNLVGVCTHPKFRGRGFMGELLRKVTQDLYDSGVPFLLNTPTDEQIYHKFGHARVLRKKICEIEGGGLGTPNDGNLSDIYRSFSKKYSCMVVRDENDMSSRIADVTSDGGIVASNRGAYALYHMEDFDIVVDELCFTDVASMKELLAGLPKCNVRFELPDDYLCPENGLFREFSSVLMRIIHLENFLNILPFSLPMCVEIVDNIIPKNKTVCYSGNNNSKEHRVSLDIAEYAMFAMSTSPAFNTDPY